MTLLTVLIVSAPADLLRNGPHTGPGHAQAIRVELFRRAHQDFVVEADLQSHTRTLGTLIVGCPQSICMILPESSAGALRVKLKGMIHHFLLPS